MIDRNIRDIADLVNLVLKYQIKWEKEYVSLTPEEGKILFSIVVMAGFNVKEIMPGKLVAHYLGLGGCKINSTYLINELCPFKVVNGEGKDYYFATGWLDCVFQQIIHKKESGKTKGQIIEALCSEIERSLPLPPIQLTRKDWLEECPVTHYFSKNGYAYFVSHARDNSYLVKSFVGIHRGCNGKISRDDKPETHDVLFCTSCSLKVSFPKTIRTYGELREIL